MEINIIYYAWFAILLISSSSGVPFAVPINAEEDYLSFTYAKFIQKNPGGKENISPEERERHILIATELTKVGYQYYEMKKDKEAIEKYEEALSHYASGELYYYYGNSLSNTKRLKDAIKSYKIALAFDYHPKERVYYNIACAYSRLEDKEKAFEYLEIAIINGYANINWIKKDKDLTFLRSQSEWGKWLSKRKELFKPMIPKQGLIAEYLFNGNAIDNSGNKNDGTVYGAILIEDRFGNLNSAYRFDGVDDFIQLPLAPVLNLVEHDFTILAWIKADYYREVGDVTIIGMDRGENGGVLHLTIRGKKPYMGFYNNDTKGKTILSKDVWYHIVFRYTQSSQSQAIFVNGVLDTNSAHHPALKGYEYINIGRWASGRTNEGNSYFDGIIDDIYIYNRALSVEEIKALYHNES